MWIGVRIEYLGTQHSKEADQIGNVHLEIFNNLNGFDKQEYTGTEPLTKDTDLVSAGVLFKSPSVTTTGTSTLH